METVVSLSSLLVMPFWLAMIVAPRWRVTRRVMEPPLIILAPALLYSLAHGSGAASHPPLRAAWVRAVPLGALPALTSPTLAGVAGLLGTSAGATIAWAHFLTFDLFVGRWEYLDSRERDLSARARRTAHRPCERAGGGHAGREWHAPPGHDQLDLEPGHAALLENAQRVRVS
jgi:hypothetical protein